MICDNPTRRMLKVEGRTLRLLCENAICANAADKKATISHQTIVGRRCYSNARIEERRVFDGVATLVHSSELHGSVLSQSELGGRC
jgi:hypothetical protein